MIKNKKWYFIMTILVACVLFWYYTTKPYLTFQEKNTLQVQKQTEYNSQHTIPIQIISPIAGITVKQGESIHFRIITPKNSLKNGLVVISPIGFLVFKSPDSAIYDFNITISKTQNLGLMKFLLSGADGEWLDTKEIDVETVSLK